VLDLILLHGLSFQPHLALYEASCGAQICHLQIAA
jgi:hypothetical protein